MKPGDILICKKNYFYNNTQYYTEGNRYMITDIEPHPVSSVIDYIYFRTLDDDDYPILMLRSEIKDYFSPCFIFKYGK